MSNHSEKLILEKLTLAIFLIKRPSFVRNLLLFKDLDLRARPRFIKFTQYDLNGYDRFPLRRSDETSAKAGLSKVKLQIEKS